MLASLIDSLPYYDKQVDDPATKAAATALIEAELRRTPRVIDADARLPPDVDVFPRNTALAALLANYADEPIRGIDTAKYAPPTANEGAGAAELADAERRGWIAEGHMALRNENISLLSTYAPNAWLVRNYQLTATRAELAAELTALQEQATEVNRARRVFQEDTGRHLSALEGRWSDLVRATVQLAMACAAMGGEVEGLRRKEDALREEVTKMEQAET
ncbi:hypothetical protein Q5752_004371 [Cryptotrichosporon argae]